MLIYFCVVCGCFHAVWAELSHSTDTQWTAKPKIFIYSEHMSLCENMTLTSDFFNVLTVVMGFASIHEGNSAIEFAFWIHWCVQRFHRHRLLWWEV